jgi:hypothetical protein
MSREPRLSRLLPRFSLVVIPGLVMLNVLSVSTVSAQETPNVTVGGHENLNGGGQETERWRPRKLNGRGQENCFV